MLKIDLTDKRVLVIGGAAGIGRAVVEQAASCGARVGWCDLNREGSETLAALLTARGVNCFFTVADCTCENEIADFFTAADREFGGMDALVYCAGFTSPVKFLDIDYSAWRKVVDINLNGAYLAVRKSIVRMLKNEHGGSIVLVGSAAFATGGGGRADYASGKAGLEGLNRAITREFAPHKIRCNLIHPSLIETDLLKKRHLDPVRRRELAKEVPLRCLGQPEDIAKVAVFFLSDLASYITAQSIFVDGGRTFCK